MNPGHASFVYLHGGGQGSWVWDASLEAMQRQGVSAQRLLALDVPGCGSKCARDTANLGFDDVCTELLDDIDQSGLKNIVLVGHSQAGNLMPAFAVRRPDLFLRLVYVSCSVPLPGQTVIELMGTGLHGENDNEVGWPSEARASEMRARLPLLFCNDMAEHERSEFLGRAGKDNWPMAMYTYRDWGFVSESRVPARYVCCLRDAGARQGSCRLKFHAAV